MLLVVLFSIGCTRSLQTNRPPAGISLSGRVVYRHYEAPHRDGDGTPGGVGRPLAITLDEEGNAWVLGEFHTKLQVVSAPSSLPATRQIWIPHHPDALPFGSRRGFQSQISVLGEGLIVDPDGRVWLSQGGGHLVREGANHSRVVSYDPESDEFRAYNLPGNRNEAVGLFWDAARGLVWVAEYGKFSVGVEEPSSDARAGPRAGSLIAFDPETTPHSNDFLWDRSLDHLLCADPTDSPAGCFARYELPDGALAPAHLTGDASGSIWFTLFWGRSIGRLDPRTGEVILYPLADGIGTDRRAEIVGPGPWDIEISPDGKHVVWSEFFDSTFSRLPLEQALDPTCRSLREGRNPCVEEMRVPAAALGNQRVGLFDFDRFGNLWFTQAPAYPVAPGVPNSIGFVTSDWSRVVILDPSEVGAKRGGAYAGIAVDPETNDIWVAEFIPPGVSLFMRVDREVDPASWKPGDSSQASQSAPK